MDFPRFSRHRWLIEWCPLFELHWTQVAQHGMATIPIVKSLHIFKDRGASRLPSRVMSVCTTRRRDARVSVEK